MADKKSSVRGLRELEMKLDALSKEYGPKEAKKALRTPIRKAMKPVLEDVRSNTPTDTGALEKSAKLRVRAPSRKLPADNPDVTLIGTVGWENSNMSKQLAVEFGNSNQSAQPTLRPALESNADEVTSIFGRELGDSIDKTAKKLAKK